MEREFQLSVLAMAGVLFLAPALEVAAWRLPGVRALAAQDGVRRGLAAFVVAGLAATLGAALTTLPVVWGAFGMLPALALPATVFALPAFPIIMGAGGLTALLALLHPALAPPLAWLAWGGTAWLLAVVQAWAQVPLAALDLGRPPAVVGWVYGAALFALMAGVQRTWPAVLWRPRTPRPHLPLRRLAPGLRAVLRPPITAGLVLSAAILVVAWSGPDRGLRLWFLNGGGDAVLVRTPGGATILVGGSPDPGALARALGRVLPFWQRDLDLVLLPQPGQEHLPGLRMVLDRYRVGQVMEGPATATTLEYREWARGIQARGLPRSRLEAGAAIDLGDGLALRVLAAPRTGGMALALEGLGGSAVLLDRAATRALHEGELAAAALRPSPVLKLAWATGDLPLRPALLERTQPRVLISVGAAPSPQDEGHTAAVYAVPVQGTLTLGWGEGDGWLWTER
ncbi:MAG: ComEC/Rec2 family competence protein [Chloroflexi bacterium]|nr:ComEC/Rec2 family competence protein [Chloroflexota bacterium]